MTPFSIGQGALLLDELVALAETPTHVQLSEQARTAISQSRALVDDYVQRGTAVYGLTMFLGSSRDRRIPDEELDVFQRDLVVYHAGDTGAPIPTREVRAMMIARLRGFAAGHSGVALPLAERYLEFINQGVTPVVRRNGSVGASDLAPLAAIARGIIGEGTVDFRGEARAAADVLEELSLEPLALTGKDGLALISANSYSVGLGAIALREFTDLCRLMERAFLLHLESTDANISWLSAECSDARPFAGQNAVAERLRGALAGSRLYEASTAASLQDPLSVRSFTHMLGAALAVASTTARALELELNSSGDNPLVDVQSGRIISSANFNPFEIALGFESLRTALAHLGGSIERRLHRIAHFRHALVDEVPGLPVGGTFTFSFGTTIARLRTLAHPVTLDVPVLALGQEDAASGAPLAVDYCRDSIKLVRELVVAELLLSVDLLVARGVSVAPSLVSLVASVREQFPDGSVDCQLGEALERVSDLKAPPSTTRDYLSFSSGSTNAITPPSHPGETHEE